MKFSLPDRLIQEVRSLPVNLQEVIIKYLIEAADWGYEIGQTCYDDDHLRICLTHRLDACFCDDIHCPTECKRCKAIEELMKVLDSPKAKQSKEAKDR